MNSPHISLNNLAFPNIKSKFALKKLLLIKIKLMKYQKMKKKLSTVLLALVAFMPMTAQNLVKGDYGYLYCHMSDKGEWTAYAISRDGYNYQDINDGNPIFNP